MPLHFQWVGDLLLNEQSNRTAADFVRDRFGNRPVVLIFGSYT